MLRALVLALVLAALPARAQDRPEVDLALILAVDVSRSMSADELELQRRGYAAALNSRDVMVAITSGYLGRIGLAYVEWAGEGSQRLTVGWTMIETPADAAAFADRIAAGSTTMRRTSISGALLFAEGLFADSPFTALRQVVDISGDGPNNQGPPVIEMRDRLVAGGITINGLPLMTAEGAVGSWNIADLDRYYEACVIGGPGAFVLPVRDWAEFAGAVRRKLVLEISGLAAAGLKPAQMSGQSSPAAGYDCLVGERIWEQRRGWDFR